MIMLIRRRRPALWVRLLRIVGIAASAVGFAIGAEALRRKLGIGAPRVSVVRNGRTTRMRVTVGRGRKRHNGRTARMRVSLGRGRKRAVLTASRS